MNYPIRLTLLRLSFILFVVGSPACADEKPWTITKLELRAMVFPEVEVDGVIDDLYSIIYFVRNSQPIHVNEALWGSVLTAHKKGKLDLETFPMSKVVVDLLFSDPSDAHFIVSVREGDFISISSAGVLGEVCQILPSKKSEDKLFKSRDMSESLTRLAATLLPIKDAPKKKKNAAK